MNRHEVSGAAVIFLFGAATVCFSARMPIGDFRAPGSGLFPLCLGILLMFLSGMHIFRVSLQGGRRVTEEVASFSTGFPRPARRVILFLCAIMAGTFLLGALGYPLVSFLLLLALLRILGMTNWGLNFLLAFTTAGVCYFLFVQWLGIPLPKGWVGL
ncbi:MAG: tripartite tricarboxylate transporter TctB family protein [Deltaproteobacteria bacterium]|nr:tripartite tricarboxylate transporter TctB family protein [Deltaproteobacteria bacterium]